MSVIAIIDYDIGNIKSISNAFKKVGADVVITRDEKTLLEADGVVLPGVGAFAHGMKKLNEYGLVDTVRKVANSNKPLLGICLGMQMLFTRSDEFGESKGLDLIPGKVCQITPLNQSYQKLPHVSWSEIKETSHESWDRTILKGIPGGQDMYFVHSYMAVPDNLENILSTTVYSDLEFCSTVKKNNIYGCQYHPEKSAVEGLKIINNFLNICQGKKNV